MEIEQAVTRRCETCLSPLLRGNARQRFCGPPCKAEGWRRKHGNDTTRTPIPRKTPNTPPAPVLRDCPHCGEPVAIVTMLATPHVARPDTPNRTR